MRLPKCKEMGKRIVGGCIFDIFLLGLCEMLVGRKNKRENKMIHSDIQLMQLYRELRPEWAKFLLNPCGRFWLPTERVFSKPEFHIPEFGRIYACGLFLFEKPGHPPITGPEIWEAPTELWAFSPEEDNELFFVGDYEEFNNLPEGEFKGTAHFPDVWLCEAWYNHGDDGHTEMRMHGYQFVNRWRFNDAQKRSEAGESQNWGGPLQPYIRPRD